MSGGHDAAGSLSIGVAMATRNGMPWLPEQLESILAQHRPPHRVVVSDDGSSDGTLAFVDELRARHPLGDRIAVLRNEAPLGVAANFEQAIGACGTDLVALSDQDDVWHPDRLDAAAMFERRPALQLVHGDARLIDGGGRDLGSLFGALAIGADDVAAIHAGDAYPRLLRRNLATGATMMFRSALARRAAPFPASWVHDEWLAIVAAAEGGVDVLEEPLIDYRQHGGNEIGAERLDLRGRVARLRAPRRARDARLLARAQALAERMPSIAGPDSERTIAAVDKLEHERRRSALPGPRLRRAPQVIGELITGRYGRFGNGLQDVLRDLVQPDDAGGARVTRR